MVPALEFLHLIFVGFVALFPPVNPIGTAFVVDPLLKNLDRRARKAAARRIALYCFVICVSATLVGSWLFKLFGISLPIVQLAGGIMICRMGWQLLLSDDGAADKAEAAPHHRSADVDDILFYPLAFPMTTGAGTISVLLTLSAHGHEMGFPLYFLDLGALISAIVIMCIVIYASYAFTPALLKKLGNRGGQIVNRLSAFLVFCVGLQIALDGLTHIIHNHLLS